MGVKIRKLRGEWYLVIDCRGTRKKRAIGYDRKVADEVRRQVEARLALGDLEILEATDATNDATLPMFGTYPDRSMRDYARVECKKSSAQGYESVLGQSRRISLSSWLDSNQRPTDYESYRTY